MQFQKKIINIYLISSTRRIKSYIEYMHINKAIDLLVKKKLKKLKKLNPKFLKMHFGRIQWPVQISKALFLNKVAKNNI